MSHPYKSSPNFTKWRNAVSDVPHQLVDPVVDFRFKILKTDRVATAGSCFAQHIAKNLIKSGFNYYVTETPHPIIKDVALNFGYGAFSARYGNIYTSRQLLQLIKRAFNLFITTDSFWLDKNDNFVDPIRPTVQKNGFISIEELNADIHNHLAAVRDMFKNLTFFVFTLGLTECWVNKRCGTAYPLCPGVAAGKYDPELHAFINFGVNDVVADLTEFFNLLKMVNPNAKLILTVSPVALAATAENRNILLSNCYSKSVLRVAAEMMTSYSDDIAYFPSYEIITGIHARENYNESDLRNVTDAGVEKVMNLFFKHATSDAKAKSDKHDVIASEIQRPSDTNLMKEFSNLLNIECDEKMLDK